MVLARLVLSGAIVIARIKEERRGQVLVDGEINRVFPFYTCELKIGEPIDTCLPGDVIHDLVSEVQVDIGTPVMFRVMSLLNTMTPDERIAIYVSDDVRERS